ncbi:MAG: AIPR family protein [Flavobacterium sp.]|uniref:AIPR family protein n=1 Tax=Flavobacterium sp. TaxID=239 RepID=UPI0025C253FB|nr:AIPR family protein [Flavobacterium sp.]MCA1967150.1 AIPR family protein [Flavobacterium sp.]
MSKYSTLVNILDTIIKEAPTSMSKKYSSDESDNEQLNQSRSRAFIHLYLKVSFGLLLFEEREHFLTDGSYDGGIDGYYINPENKTIYLIQSKFRTNDKNFENKQIAFEEILTMDVNRILDGETKDERGNEYNGKIKQLQREISNTDSIGRYSYQIVILANLADVKSSDLRKLSGGIACEVFNFETCYQKLVFPVITGTFFNATDLSINIDLSNKNAGSKISYTVQTKKGKCEITVLFIPTIELAKVMFKYKNSILKFNPRSYLGHEGKNVHNSIRETITQSETNEFALFNNGITMLSDETYINEKIGQKNKAQLIVKNPQIINGGQTSYTLSKIFEENIENNVEEIFKDKEVLIKIITLQENNDIANKLDLINAISDATNKQTPIINADRFSNEKLQIDLQKTLFDNYNLHYERKRGEFADGIYNNYITENSIIERNHFYKMFYASNGKIDKASEKKLFYKQGLTIDDFSKDELDNAYFGHLCFKRINGAKNPHERVDIADFAKIYAMTYVFKPKSVEDYQNAIDENIEAFNSKWTDFLNYFTKSTVITKIRIDKITGEKKSYQKMDYRKWYNSSDFANDVAFFYND